MEKLADYVLQEKIHETRNSIIYRGHKENESQPFIIKLLKTKYPTPSEIARFKQEYNLVKKLDIKNIIKIFDLVEHDDKYALIEEDFGGVSLKKILKTKELGLKSFLQISSKISETLGLIHKNNIIHLDIKPDNILINPELSEVKITDFGISTALTHANDELYNPDVIKGTLSYMSPEQTGRMNRGVDYRTDMYSLGVTFYEMLTGEVPFQSNDPMELIHSHIARQPSAPSDLKPSIPPVLSSIILKLLSKNPEERYQNCLGLMADIDECLKQLNQKGGIDEFLIATRDISIRFNVPQTLVDRKEELNILMKSFERASNGTSEMLLVLGQPGIGKSALVNEIHKPIVAKKGYFISGKYDQFRKDVPYSAIIQSFQGLIRQIIAESEEKIQSWKEKLLFALGPNGKIITDVIPELELIILKQPDVPLLGPEESQNRFNLVFQNFVNVFTTEDHPLVLFLDDLQWADQASLKFLENIMTGYKTKYLFLIGAYRDNEVSQAHPLTLTIDEIRKKGRNINGITLGPLNLTGINSIIMNVLMCNTERSMPLAELINRKTAGNPFFVIQFLKNLYDNRILELDPRTGWEWDINKIREMQVTDNVVEFMAGKISSFPKKTQEILKICSCIGNRFDLETLSIVSGMSIAETLTDLTSAIREDMISLYENIYKFHHDRIQEAAYSMIPSNEKTEMHYRIGSNVLKKTDTKNLNEMIFYIVDQLDRGLKLVTGEDEKIELATLNLQAAQKAKNSTAYASALSYLKTGIGLLPDDCWESHYELSYSMYREAMECEYLTLNLEDAEKTFALVAKKAKSNIDKANVHSLMIVLYTTRGNYKDALRVGLEGMRMVGFKVPPNPSDIRLGWELLKLRLKFGRRKIEDLINMQYIPNPKNLAHRKELTAEYMQVHPTMFKSTEDPYVALFEKLSYAYLAIHTGTVAFYYNPNLFAYIVISGITYLLKYDVTFEYSPYAYGAMGCIVGSSLGFYQHGYRFGETALKVNEKIADTKNRCRVEFLFPMFVQHWKKHAKFDLDYYRNAYKHGIETGDLIFSGHNINLIGMTRIMLGDNIDNVLEEYGKYRDFQLGGKDPFIAHNYAENTRMCLCLKGLTDARGDLNGDGFNEEEQANYYKSDDNMLGTFYFSLVRLRINYLFGELEKCRHIIPALQRQVRKKVALGNLHVAEFYFYHSLTLTASYHEAGFFKKILYKNRLQLNQIKMLMWTKSCPENFQHKYDLVAAEMMAIKGRYREAKMLYHAAIEGARQNGYLQNEAIACERLALFYLGSSDEDEAKIFMQRAYRCYASWGASAKEQDLQERYPDLLRVDTKTTQADTSSWTTPSENTSRTLDLATVMKVSQVISGEIMLDRLLQKIMHMSIANAGAQRGYLILNTDGELTIEASEDVDKNESLVMQSMALKDCDGICEAIVNYVQRTEKDVVLGNAMQEGPFTDDDYIIRSQCKSILCTPIMSKGKLSGILYMENNLSLNAFTPERLEILQSFSAQAAISIDNARLFELATTDGLTKLYVHRYFQLLLDQEMKRSRRHNKKFSLIMMDIDNFKSFNDTYGHQLGDEVLRNVARVIKNTSRTEDIAARYGGEEFIVILPETDAQQAMSAAEKIRASVAEIKIPHGDQRLHVTISLGVSTYPEHAGAKEALIRLADAALYTSKRNGKNRVSLCENKELIQDSANLIKQTEKSQREEEEKYRNILENMQEGYFETDLAGNYTFLNESSCRIHGYPREELMGMNNRQYTEKEVAKKVFKAFNEVYKTGEPLKSIDWQITRKDGTKIYVEASVSLRKDEFGKPIGFRGIINDITERRKIEERYRLLADNMTEHVWLMDLNTMKTIYVSPSVEKMYGYTLDEFKNLSLKKILTTESFRKMVESSIPEIAKAMATPAPYVHKHSLELEARHKDGHLLCIENTISYMRDENGNLSLILGETRDITDRKHAEESLRQNEEKYRTIIENIQDGYFEVDLSGNFTFFNDSTCLLHGYSKEELMGMNYRQYTDKETAKKLFQTYNKVYSTGITGHIFEYEIIRKDGNRRQTESFASLIKDSAGNPNGFRAIIRDITVRKQADELLKQSEEKYRLLADHMKDQVWLMDLNLNITYISPSVEKLVGYSLDEIKKIQLEKLLTKESLEKAVNFLSIELPKALAAPPTYALYDSLELEFILRDGQTIWGECMFSFIRDESGNPVSILGEGREITERKHAKEKLQQTLESLKKSIGTTIQVLVAALETRDPYTAGHQARSADLATAIATEMGLPQDTIDGIHMAGIIHDIGKLAIPAEILTKPTKLTNLEFSLIIEHARRGYEMLKDIESPWPLADIVHQHHERINGTGYPRQLKGEDILIESRILAVADVVEAMASHRPYRPSLGIDPALEEIEKNKGVLYDETVADACLRLFREKGYQLT